MENPGDKPTKIFKGDRWWGTTNGLKHTPGENEKTSRANLGRKHPEERVKKQSVVYEKVSPFFYRYLSAGEIACIVGPDFRLKQIRNTMFRKDYSKFHLLPEDYFSTEEKEKRRDRTRKIGRSGDLVYVRTLSENSKFLHEFWESGFFTKDISNWQELNDLYTLNKRTLPESVFDQLRLEVFFTALSLIKSKGDHRWEKEYERLVGEPNSLFAKKLSREEQFIKERIFPIVGANEWNNGGKKGKKSPEEITLEKIREVLKMGNSQ